jgi:hypothetical protein
MLPVVPPLPPPLAAIRLPGGGSVIWKSSKNVGQGFQCGLPRRTGEEASNLLAVPFDDDNLALDGQSIQYPAQIARQVSCRDRLQLAASMRKV